MLQVLYDAVHAAALSLAGATSLLHEAKVDIVTVPNLSEHLSSTETTEQLSARFAYAAAMKSINNLLLLGDGESWSRQSVDFSGLPEMARTFLQVAAGAADIPVTRLLGQSPSGLSATGESDVRNYYDMIAARQELDLHPQLERLDRLICWSEDIDEGALGFTFRPLWQLDEPAKAALALSKAQATQIYAGLKLWPAAVTAKLVEAQLVQDGTYPNAVAVFAESGAVAVGDAAFADDLSAGGAALNYLHEKRNRIGEWAEEDEDADDLLGLVSWRERRRKRLKAKRHRELEREKRRRRERSEQYGSPTAPGHSEDPSPQSEQNPTAATKIPKPFELQNSDKHVIPSQPGKLNSPDAEIPLPSVPPSSPAPIGSPQPSRPAHAPDQAIRFGNNGNQILHAFRHTDDAGLDRESVENAVRGDLISRFDKLQDGLNYGHVIVDGQNLDYNAYKFSNGDVNVGRITIPR